MGKGHLPSPGKLKSVIAYKNSISKVSLNGRDAAFTWRKTVNDCSTPTISFLYTMKELCCCTLILKNDGTPDSFPRFGIGKPVLIVPRFYHIHRRSGATIVAASASGHLEVKNCTKIHLHFALPQSPCGGSSLPKNPPRYITWGQGTTQTYNWIEMGIEPKPNTPNLNPIFGLSEPNRSTEATQRDQLTKAIRTELSGYSNRTEPELCGKGSIPMAVKNYRITS